LHYRILDNWGYKDFAKTWRKKSIEEMQDASWLQGGRLNAAWAYASPQVQSALPAERDGPRAGRIRPRKSKEIQRNPRKKAWISLDFFGGIGAFQWVTANPNKKILLLSHCIPDVTKAESSGGARVSIGHYHLSTINEHFGPPPLQHLSKPSGYGGRPKTSRNMFCFSEYRRCLSEFLSCSDPHIKHAGSRE
jgi:hypothetical protein